ncbi:MAG TPA: efflux RND transporter periplasmic adaptor subunit, partial [Candidatus Binataceae bacterium]|nr:efflux RND transporter periplasmic adaptor subunit [Candidatus Binataceae bacterium]
EIRLFGRTIAKRHISIRAPAAGRVEGLRLSTGDTVHRGQVVARIVSREIEAAEAGLSIAKRIDPGNAAELAAAIERNRTGPGISVTAPDSGVVSQPPIANGQMVADLDPIADLIDPSSLYVEASVPIGQVHLLKPGMAALVTTPIRPGAVFPARITATLPTFDPNSVSSVVRIDFSGPQRVGETGAPVEVRAEIARASEAISIPSAALFQDAGPNRFHVFIIGHDGRAHRTAVTIGIREDGRVQIASGLNAGDLAITSGGYSLSDGLLVRTAKDTR